MPISLEALEERLVAFRDQRDWKQFHTPRNLSMALASEVGELLGELRWATDEAASEDDALREALTDEIADIGIFLVLLCESLGVDLAEAMQTKITRNESRFPPNG
jgi:dCTP diphosphatase